MKMPTLVLNHQPSATPAVKTVKKIRASRRRDDRDTGAPGAGQPPDLKLLQALESVTASSSANSNRVETLNRLVSDPPSRVDVVAILNKLNELIVALRREN